MFLTAMHIMKSQKIFILYAKHVHGTMYVYIEKLNIYARLF